MKENLVKHFDTIHGTRDVYGPDLAQITLTRRFGNIIRYRNDNSKMTLKPIAHVKSEI